MADPVPPRFAVEADRRRPATHQSAHKARRKAAARANPQARKGLSNRTRGGANR